MKRILPLSFCLLFLGGPLLSAQTPALNQFYRQYKRGKEVKNFRVPGWVVKLGSKIALRHSKDPNAKPALSLAKKFGKMKIMISEGGRSIPPQAVERLTAQLRRQKFDDWIYVREEGTTVNIMARESKGRLRNLLILVNEGDEFVFLSVKTKLKARDIGKVVEWYMKTHKPKPIRKPDEKIPQV